VPAVHPRIVAAVEAQLETWRAALDAAAANVFHRAVACGPTRRGASVAGAHARLLVEGEVGEDGPATGDHAATVRVIARLLAAVGERLEPGDRILAGSVCHVPVAPGDCVVAEIDGLGAVAVTIAA
jgi:2-keto-4-pentenoate hydratase